MQRPLSAQQLDRYFARIAYRGPRDATLGTLRALHRAHLLAIPYENLDIHLGRPIDHQCACGLVLHLPQRHHQVSRASLHKGPAQPQNPLSSLALAQCYAGLPPGTVNVVTGGARTGELLVAHRGIDMVAFTGSTAAGRRIAALAGQNLRKVNLELGGIDPFIVFEDADMDVAVRGVAWARLLNAGQVCTTSKRIILVKPMAAEFTRHLRAYVRRLRVGDPMHPDTDIGPLITAQAAETVERQVAQAREEGARLLAGGRRFQPKGLAGHFRMKEYPIPCGKKIIDLKIPEGVSIQWVESG